jgi:hypothetical protein
MQSATAKSALRIQPHAESILKHRADAKGTVMMFHGFTAGPWQYEELANRLHMKTHGGAGIPSSALNVVVPALGGAAGLAYSLYKAKELEEMKRAVKPRSDNSSPAQ